MAEHASRHVANEMKIKRDFSVTVMTREGLLGRYGNYLLLVTLSCLVVRKCVNCMPDSSVLMKMIVQITKIEAILWAK